MDKFEMLLDHYCKIWNNNPQIYLWDKGPIDKLPSEFRVLEFPPTNSRNMWTYATCGMSLGNNHAALELHIFSSIKDVSIVELLTSLAYYHNVTSTLGLNHTVNFGQPWQEKSKCEYGFISLPYLDGPELEVLEIKGISNITHFYWLIPVTKSEVEYKAKFGAEALEAKFEVGLDYINPNRDSLVD